MILDLGSGSVRRSGVVSVDINPASDADVIHDLNQVPYPFDESVADEIYLDNVLEHLDDVVAVVGELYRVGKPSALVTVFVPYFRSRWAAIDPTHRHQFTVDSFAYFDPGHPFWDRYRYSTARFRVESVTFNERWPGRSWRGVVAWYANRHPERYEAVLSQLLPLDELTVRLRSLKE